MHEEVGLTLIVPRAREAEGRARATRTFSLTTRERDEFKNGARACASERAPRLARPASLSIKGFVRPTVRPSARPSVLPFVHSLVRP